MAENTENYSLTAAVADFKAGVQQYQKRQWNAAFPFIQRALKKFQEENQAKLILECSYLLGNIFLQKKIYPKALPYLEQTQELAQGLQHGRYWQEATYQRAFAHYKLGDYRQAVELFQRLGKEDQAYVNQAQRAIFLARAYHALGSYPEAVQTFEQALAVLTTPITSNQQVQGNQFSQEAVIARIYAEKGQSLFALNRRTIQTQGLQALHTEAFETRMDDSIASYLKSAEHWEKAGESARQIEVLQIVAGVYGFLRDLDLQIHYLQRALDLAEKMRDFQKVVSILRTLTDCHQKAGRYQEIVSLLSHALETFSQFVYTNPTVIAEFQWEIGKALVQLDEYTAALKQYFAALNTYQKLKIITEEQGEVLQSIIQVYAHLGHAEKLAYYQSQYNAFQAKTLKPVVIPRSALGILKGLWIFTQSGIEIYSNNPGSNLDPTLFGGFVSALQSLSQEIAQDTLKSFVIGETRFTFYLEPEHHLYLLGHSALTTPKGLVIQTLKRINDAFYQQYRPAIINFTGNVTPFTGFTAVLQDLDLTGL